METILALLLSLPKNRQVLLSSPSLILVLVNGTQNQNPHLRLIATEAILSLLEADVSVYTACIESELETLLPALLFVSSSFPLHS